MEITQLHDEIFDFLFEKHLEARARGEEFYFRMWQDKDMGLQNPRKDFIFFGNAVWLQLSFWTGYSSNQNYFMPLFIHEKSTGLEKSIEFQIIATADTFDLADEIAKVVGIDHSVDVRNFLHKKSYGNYTNNQDLIAKINDFIENDKKKIDEYLDTISENSPIRKIKEYEFESELFKKNFSSITPISIIKDSLPYTLNRIWVRNFHGIKETNIEEIPSSTKWIFVTGENGIGKTVLLQAIALGLQSVDWFNNSEILIGTEYTIKDKIAHSFKRYSFLYGYEQPLNDIPVVAYGCNRLNIESITNLGSPIGHLFGNTNMINVDYWLKKIGSSKVITDKEKKRKFVLLWK
jgi:hypothetical protein